VRACRSGRRPSGRLPSTRLDSHSLDRKVRRAGRDSAGFCLGPDADLRPPTAIGFAGPEFVPTARQEPHHRNPFGDCVWPDQVADFRVHTPISLACDRLSAATQQAEIATERYKKAQKGANAWPSGTIRQFAPKRFLGSTGLCLRRWHVVWPLGQYYHGETRGIEAGTSLRCHWAAPDHLIAGW